MDVRWVVLYSVVALAALVGAVLAAIAIFIVVMLALLFVGGPGLVDACDDRPIDRDPATLVHFDDRWENFNVRIDARARSTSILGADPARVPPTVPDMLYGIPGTGGVYQPPAGVYPGSTTPVPGGGGRGPSATTAPAPLAPSGAQPSRASPFGGGIGGVPTGSMGVTQLFGGGTGGFTSEIASAIAGESQPLLRSSPRRSAEEALFATEPLSVSFDESDLTARARAFLRAEDLSVSFDESDLTARARAFLRAEDVQEIRDVIICLSGDEIEATGKLTIAILPDVNVRLTGDIDFSGEHPVVTITDVDVGSLPGFLTSSMEEAIADGVNEALEEVNLEREFQLTINDGVATIEFLP